jgi:hypothetical protein
MAWKHELQMIGAAALIVVLVDTRAKLRADLDAAMREIRNLKELIGAKGAAEKGPLYAGQPARYWVNQLADTSPRLRIEALEALGALAPKDRDLIPVILKTLKEDSDSKVGGAAVKALAAAGPEALPALIDIAKDPTEEYPKHGRRRALEVFRIMKSQAAPAVPTLVSLLREKSTQAGTFRVTIWTLRDVGPDAKEAIPALVDALELCLRDIGKKDGFSHFGLSDTNTNVSVISALLAVDPKLREVLPSEERLGVRLGKPGLGKGGKIIRPPSQEQLEVAWREAHAALLKAVQKK